MDDYAEFAGTPDEEKEITEEAIYKFREKRFLEHVKTSNYSQFISYADAEKESGMSGEQLLNFRHERFIKHIDSSKQQKHFDFKGTEEEEQEVATEWVIKFRKEKELAKITQDYWDKINTVVTYPKFTTKEFAHWIINRRAKDVFGIHTEGKDKGKSKIILDNQSKPVLKLLCMYFNDDKAFEQEGYMDSEKKEVKYSLDKGILLFSKVGCGKTDTMRLFTNNPKQPFSMVHCNKVAEDYAIDGDEQMLKYYRPTGVTDERMFFGHKEMGTCFDDLGTENESKHYGAAKNVMEAVILRRYANKHELRCKTHITTNLNLKDIENQYSTRVLSRMHEMFNFIMFPEGSKDRRKP